MLELEIPQTVTYDEAAEEFLTHSAVVLKLEHSLISLAKWESVWKTPWLSREKKTAEQIRSYVQCMTLRPVDDAVIDRLTDSQLASVVEYLNDPHTATTFAGELRFSSSKIITAEVIYGWLVSLQIPFECEKWHLNRLMTLVRVVNQTNSPGSKIPKNEVLSQNRALNNARRAQYGTRG